MTFSGKMSFMRTIKVAKKWASASLQRRLFWKNYTYGEGQSDPQPS